MVNKKEAEQKIISIHWWNMGKKTLDFKGELKDFLIKKDITVRECSKNSINGYKFRIPLSSSTNLFETYNSDYAVCSSEAIKVFLTLLGDKTLYNDPYGREHKINWN